MKKICHEINGFFLILSFIIKDMDATVTPNVRRQLPDTSGKPASTMPGFATDQNDAIVTDAAGN